MQGDIISKIFWGKLSRIKSVTFESKIYNQVDGGTARGTLYQNSESIDLKLLIKFNQK